MALGDPWPPVGYASTGSFVQCNTCNAIYALGGVHVCRALTEADVRRIVREELARGTDSSSEEHT